MTWTRRRRARLLDRARRGSPSARPPTRRTSRPRTPIRTRCSRSTAQLLAFRRGHAGVGHGRHAPRVARQRRDRSRSCARTRRGVPRRRELLGRSARRKRRRQSMLEDRVARVGLGRRVGCGSGSLHAKLPGGGSAVLRDHAMKKLASIAVCLACSSSPPPCTAGVSTGSADLTLVGTGSCATTLRLDLRVATGSPAAPAWSDASSAGLQVQGVWTTRKNGAVRSVTVVNASAQPVTLVGLEWSTDAGGVGLARRSLAPRRLPELVVHRRRADPGDAHRRATAPRRTAATTRTCSARSPASRGGGPRSPTRTASGLVAGADGGTVLKTYLAVDGATRRAPAHRPGRDRRRAHRSRPASRARSTGSTSRSATCGARLDELRGLRWLAPSARSRRARPRSAAGARGTCYYAMPTASALRAESAWAREHLAPLGLSDFLLDDGYEIALGLVVRGARRSAPTRTRSTAEQTAAGLRPAVWLAPFYVATTDPLVTAAPRLVRAQRRRHAPHLRQLRPTLRRARRHAPRRARLRRAGGPAASRAGAIAR